MNQTDNTKPTSDTQASSPPETIAPSNAMSERPGTEPARDHSRAKAGLNPDETGLTDRLRLERSLRDSELRYRGLFEKAQEGILILDAETGAITDVNPYLIEMLEYSREGFIDKRLWQVGAFKDIEAGEDAFEALQRSEYIRYEHLPLRAKSGRLIPVEFVSNVYLVGDGRIIQCSIRDISKRKRTEEALQASQLITAGIVDAIPVRVFWKDTSLVYLGCNAAFARDAGFADPKDVIGKDDYQMAWRDQAELYRGDDRQVINSGSSRLNVEEPSTTAEGNAITLLTSKVPLRSSGGEIIGILGTYMDITERKRAEEALRASEERFRSILDNIEDGYYEVDTAGNLTFVNHAHARMLGRPTNELMGLNYRSYMTPAGARAVFGTFNRVFRTGIPDRAFDWELVRPDGTLRSVEVSVSLIKAADGSVNGFRGIVRDITERKQAEEALRESEVLYRTLFDDTPIGLGIADHAGNLRFFNDAILQPGGYTRDDISRIGNVASLYHSQEQRAEVLAVAQQQGSVHQHPVQFKRKDGTYYDALLSMVPVQIKGESGWQAMVEDITERKRAEEEIRRENDTRTVLNTLLRLSLEDVPLDDLLTQALDLILSIRWLAFESRGAVFLAEDDQFLVLKSQRGLAEPIQTACARIPFGRCLCGRAAAEQKTNFADRLDVHHETTYEGMGPHGHYCVPILSAGKTLGVINIYLREGHPRDLQEETFLLAVADTLAGSIERQRAEETLKKLSSVVEQATDLVFITDFEGVIEYVNPAFERLTGYTKDESIGQTPRILKSGKHTPDQYRQLWETIRAGKVLQGTVVNRKKDGELFYEEKIVAPLRDDQGNITHFVSTGRDITGRKEAEETLRQRLAELEAVNRISVALRSAQTLDEMLPVLLDVTLEVLHATQGSIWLYDSIKDELRPAVSRGWGEKNGVSPQAPVKPGKGITGHVFASGQPDVAREMCLSSLLSDTARQWIPPGIGGATIPIRAGEIVIGTFAINVLLPRELTPDEIHLLSTLSEIAGNAIQRTTLHQQTVRQLDRLEALHSIDIAIGASMDLRLTLNILLEHVKTQLNADAACVLLLNPHSQTLEYAAGRGFRTRSAQTAHVRLGEDFAGRAALERRIVQADDPAQIGKSTHLAALWAGEGFTAYFGVPLIAKGEVKGVLEVYHRAPFRPEPEWISFLETLAGQAAIAVDSAQLFETLQRSNADLSAAYDATIEGWSRALDLRDKETEGHTQRVAEMTTRLAKAMGIGDAELVHIRRGALLHDIGKMGVPDGILLKPGPLTDEEWAIMRTHPRLAYDMLSPISYLRPALDIPYCHHEKWDGSGYPHGMKGDQIPFSARLFAIVDVWDALRSDRPYRRAWSQEKVIEHIRSLAGTHFDPQAVKVCLESGLLETQAPE